MFTTRFTREFGVTHPLMQGGMQGVGTGEFAAAVSNAGGLGTITALTFPTPEALAGQVEICKRLTDKPFAVNLTTLPSISPPPYEEYRQMAVDAGARIMETSGSNPATFVDWYHERGVRVIHKATSVKHAIKAQEAGADAVIVLGFEAAGHPGELDVPSLVLLAAASRRLTVPIVAAGGFADGRGLVAALALGADAILLGTRLMATTETPIHPAVKDAVVSNTELDTTLIFRELSNTARVAKNSISDEVARKLRDGAEFADVRELVAGARGRQVYATGDLDAGIWWSGLAQAVIDDIPTCQDLFRTIVDDATDIISGRLTELIR
jgi:NAD(P)H-dependent flavin oxidoreductase YrpB (nitropropane dioxygenase family)